MSIISFIVLALALGISAMILMHRCADAVPIQLSSGLLVSFALATIHVALFCLGIYLGNSLRFIDLDNPDAYTKTNALVFLGFAVVVAVKQLFPHMGRKTRPVAFDLNAGTFRTLLLSVATGINGFLLGLGVGFVVLLRDSLHSALWPVWTASFLFAYLGIMFGRQHIALRPRRWMGLSSLILFATALITVIVA